MIKMKKITWVVMLCLIALCASHVIADELEALGSEAEKGYGFDASSFAQSFKNEYVEIERIPLPVHENIRWLSISPKGNYLLGFFEGEYFLFCVLDGNTKTLAFDITGDVHGNLRSFAETPDPFLHLRVSWSPDERYFALTDHYRYFAMGRPAWDLFLGDLENGTIRVLETWQKSFRVENVAGVYQTCFDDKGRKLFYSIYNNIYEDKYMTMEYDLLTGESKPLFSNTWTDVTTGSTFSCEGPELYFLPSGMFVQTAQNKSGDKLGIRLTWPVREWWESKTFFFTEEGNGYSMDGLKMQVGRAGFGSVSFQTGDDSPQAETLIFSIDQAEHSIEFENINCLRNEVYSPDGRYSFGLYRLDSNTEWGYELRVIDRTSDYAGALVRADFETWGNHVYLAGNNYLVGHNKLVDGLRGRMQWGGNNLLLALSEGVCLYKYNVLPAPREKVRVYAYKGAGNNAAKDEIALPIEVLPGTVWESVNEGDKIVFIDEETDQIVPEKDSYDRGVYSVVGDRMFLSSVMNGRWHQETGRIIGNQIYLPKTGYVYESDGFSWFAGEETLGMESGNDRLSGTTWRIYGDVDISFLPENQMLFFECGEETPVDFIEGFYYVEGDNVMVKLWIKDEYIECTGIIEGDRLILTDADENSMRLKFLKLT